MSKWTVVGGGGFVGPTPGGGMANPMTTKGDVIVGATSGTADRLAVGTDGQVLTSRASATDGVDWESQPYDVVFSYPGGPPSATVLQLICFSRSVAMLGSFAGSKGHCGQNPTSSAVYTCYKNASPIGTVTISTGGLFTFATTGGLAVSFATGDTFSILTPLADATLSSVTMTFAGTR